MCCQTQVTKISSPTRLILHDAKFRNVEGLQKGSSAPSDGAGLAEVVQDDYIRLLLGWITEELLWDHLSQLVWEYQSNSGMTVSYSHSG